MGIEFELKYRATPAIQEALLARFGDGKRIAMETTYYDTPDRFLSTRHITLRRRMENGVSVCTVKTPLDGFGRGEWDVECDNIETAIPILCKLGCGEDLISLTACGIIPVCGARFTRLAGTLNAEGCTLELALDRGILLGGGREVPLCEVEVELKEGNEEGALNFARQLAETFGLRSEMKSKFRRALDLAKES